MDGRNAYLIPYLQTSRPLDLPMQFGATRATYPFSSFPSPLQYSPPPQNSIPFQLPHPNRQPTRFPACCPILIAAGKVKKILLFSTKQGGKGKCDQAKTLVTGRLLAGISSSNAPGEAWDYRDAPLFEYLCQPTRAPIHKHHNRTRTLTLTSHFSPWRFLATFLTNALFSILLSRMLALRVHDSFVSIYSPDESRYKLGGPVAHEHK